MPPSPKSMRPASFIRRDATRSARRWIPPCPPCTSGSAPGEGRVPGHCSGIGAVPAGSRSAAANWPESRRRADDEVVRCPECGAILLRVKGFEQ